MKLKFESTRRVESFDADLHNSLKISSIFNYLQDIASQHADMLGVGYNMLQENQIFWVLSWAKVEIKSLPSYGETMKIKTWAKGKERLFYMRDYIIYNDKGDELVKATSAWLLLDAKTKRMTDLSKIGLELPSFPEEHALKEYPGKFNYPMDGATHYDRKIFYSDIDINQHVNNARYIEFILDCYNQNEHNEKKVSSLTIGYKGETHFMDELEIFRSTLPEKKSTDFIKAVRKEDSRDIFNALIEWK
ncbi:MAG: thioesterase [Spirochaetaceae bacterium]|nr:thioesterase [Spirochaetaceae bacterium]